MTELRLTRLWSARLQERSAWLGAVIATLMNIFGMYIQHRINLGVPGMPLWQSLASAVFGLLLLGFLIWRRKDITVNAAAVVYLLNAASVIVTLAFEYPYFAQYPLTWVPFQASKLGCMVAALLAPTFPAGLLAIAGHGGSALWIYWTLPLDVRDQLAFGEPWAMMAFLIAGFLLLMFRFGQVVVEQRMYAATTTLRFRDLMNTPLQTLDIGLALLKDEGAAHSDPELLTRMGRAIDNLRDINGLLLKYEKALDWTPPKSNG